jgi:hypothetical protein
MKDESDELREALKSYCKLTDACGLRKLMKRYRLDSFIRNNPYTELRPLFHFEGKSRMQLRSMLRYPDSHSRISKGYSPKSYQLLENAGGLAR